MNQGKSLSESRPTGAFESHTFVLGPRDAELIEPKPSVSWRSDEFLRTTGIGPAKSVSCCGMPFAALRPLLIEGQLFSQKQILGEQRRSGA